MGDNGTKCFPTISQYSGFFIVVVIETLVIVPCIVFCLVNFIAFHDGDYDAHHPDFSQAVSYNLLLFLFIYQTVWLLTNVLATLAAFLSIPYLVLPNLLISFFGIGICLWIFVFAIDQEIRNFSSVSWQFTCFVIGLAIFIIASLLFIYIRYITFRKLAKKKKAVRATAEKTAPTQAEAPLPAPAAPPFDAEEFMVSFSRRSTMSIHDDRSDLPPRM